MPRAHKRDTARAEQSHIDRIETHLYPIFNIRGQERPMTIPQMMRERQIVGLSMAFVDNGEIAWTKCYGYANLKDSVKMTPNTLLRAASLSKPLTAMAALHFVEAGQLQLNQDIDEQLKGWKLPESDYTREKKVTVAQLISHTSGIKSEIHDEIPPEQELPTLESIFSGKTKYPAVSMISVPGEKYKYSNIGYMVLAELLQDITSKEFDEVMKETILKPCGMHHSTFNQELAPAFKNHIATGYKEKMQPLPFYKHASYGAGALWSTSSDLGLFLMEILNTYHGKPNSGKVISPEMAKKVFEKAPGKLGFNKYYSDENLVFRNDGSISGYNCIYMGSVTKIRR